MFPEVAPPMQVEVKAPVGHTARAARTQPSHRPLETLMVAPASVARSTNLAVPDTPVVDAGLPPHFSIEPAMPPQMASSATFWSWKTMLLCNHSELTRQTLLRRRRGTYALVSVHVVPVTALGLTSVEARMLRTSKWSCDTATGEWPNGMGRAAMPVASTASWTRAELETIVRCGVGVFWTSSSRRGRCLCGTHEREEEKKKTGSCSGSRRSEMKVTSGPLVGGESLCLSNFESLDEIERRWIKGTRERRKMND